MLEHDRKSAGVTVGQVAWRSGVSSQEYQELEARERYPNFETAIASASCLAGRRRL
jgi:DNA-binding XRE family transcriptional regulator